MSDYELSPDEDFDDYDYSDDYNDCDDYDEPEVIASGSQLDYRLERIRGILFVTRIYVGYTQYRGQDIGEAHYYSDEQTGQPTELFKKHAAIALHRLGKRLKTGEEREVSFSLLQDVIEAVKRESKRKIGGAE